jgi:hypothetical protein
MLAVIYLAWTSLRHICKVVGSGGQTRPIVGLFKCSWLNLGASLSGSCGMRIGGLRVSMRLMGPEESRVVAVPGLGLVNVFADGASLSDAAPPSGNGGENIYGGGKGGNSGT